MYGPALEADGEISNGMDVWVKRTDELILEEWYRTGDYHRDHGKGLDCYAVGRTLGGGAMAPLKDGRLVLGHNFKSCILLDKGPLRISFRLIYAPYKVGLKEVTESRVITLDAGARFNRIEEIYEGLYPGTEVAAGIVLRAGGELMRDTLKGILGYWEPQNRDNNDDNGHTAIGIIFPDVMEKIVEQEGHIFGIDRYGQVSFVYYAGSGWSKGGIENAAIWFGRLKEEKMKLENPLEIEMNSNYE